MRFLLDTHTLMWYMEDVKSLSTKAKHYINEPTNQIAVSVASFYEIAIKIGIGKLQLNKSLKDYYKDTVDNKITILPISEIHLTAFIELPGFANHKDPFDRLIIATAVAENATLLSSDENFKLYQDIVKLEW